MKIKDLNNRSLYILLLSMVFYPIIRYMVINTILLRTFIFIIIFFIFYSLISMNKTKINRINNIDGIVIIYIIYTSLLIIFQSISGMISFPRVIPLLTQYVIPFALLYFPIKSILSNSGCELFHNILYIVGLIMSIDFIIGSVLINIFRVSPETLYPWVVKQMSLNTDISTYNVWQMYYSFIPGRLQRVPGLWGYPLPHAQSWVIGLAFIIALVKKGINKPITFIFLAGMFFSLSKATILGGVIIAILYSIRTKKIISLFMIIMIFIILSLLYAPIAKFITTPFDHYSQSERFRLLFNPFDELIEYFSLSPKYWLFGLDEGISFTFGTPLETEIHLFTFSLYRLGFVWSALVLGIYILLYLKNYRAKKYFDTNEGEKQMKENCNIIQLSLIFTFITNWHYVVSAQGLSIVFFISIIAYISVIQNIYYYKQINNLKLNTMKVL